MMYNELIWLTLTMHQNNLKSVLKQSFLEFQCHTLDQQLENHMGVVQAPLHPEAFSASYVVGSILVLRRRTHCSICSLLYPKYQIQCPEQSRISENTVGWNGWLCKACHLSFCLLPEDVSVSQMSSTFQGTTYTHLQLVPLFYKSQPDDHHFIQLSIGD